MGQLFKGQIGLRLLVTMGADITGATCKIKYIDPDGGRGSFNATIVTAETGVIEYITTSVTDIAVKGYWTFLGHVTFVNGNTVAGEPYTEYIYAEGQEAGN